MKFAPLLFLLLAQTAPAFGSLLFTFPTDTLPSTAGYQYHGAPEASTVQVTAAGLLIDTMGGPYGAGYHAAYYQQSNVIAPGLIEVVWRMQIQASEGTYGFYVQVDNGANAWTVVFSAGSIGSGGTASTVAFDTTGWHLYRFVVNTLNAGTGGSLYVDGAGTPLYVGGVTGSNDGNSLIFGDGISGGNARTLLSAVPEPSLAAPLALLMIVGSRLLLRTRRGPSGRFTPVSVTGSAAIPRHRAH